MLVWMLAVDRKYSSCPSRRCAFCICFLSFLGRLCENEGSAVLVNERKLVGEPLALASDRNVIFLLLDSGGVLDRTPACDVAVRPVTENSIQQSRRTEQADVACVQGRDRPPGRHLFLGQ